MFDFGNLRKTQPISVPAFARYLPNFFVFDSRKGAIYENLLATMINDVGFPLHYYGNGTEHLEIVFLLETKDGFILLEEKSTNGIMAASKAIMLGKTRYHATACYKVIPSNFGMSEYFKTIPQYAVPFLLLELKAKEKTAPCCRL